MKMYHCAVLEKTRQILVERRTVSVIATGNELSVEVSSKEPDRNRRNFFVHGFVLQYEKTRLPCTAERPYLMVFAFLC